jgi:hypothetical protein
MNEGDGTRKAPNIYTYIYIYIYYSLLKERPIKERPLLNTTQGC